jgi:hypothetical protein
LFRCSLHFCHDIKNGILINSYPIYRPAGRVLCIVVPSSNLHCSWSNPNFLPFRSGATSASRSRHPPSQRPGPARQPLQLDPCWWEKSQLRFCFQKNCCKCVNLV